MLSEEEVFHSFVYSVLATPSILVPGALHIFRSLSELDENQNPIKVEDSQFHPKKSQMKLLPAKDTKAFLYLILKKILSVPHGIFAISKTMLFSSMILLNTQSDRSTSGDIISFHVQPI